MAENWFLSSYFHKLNFFEVKLWLGSGFNSKYFMIQRSRANQNPKFSYRFYLESDDSRSWRWCWLEWLIWPHHRQMRGKSTLRKFSLGGTLTRNPFFSKLDNFREIFMNFNQRNFPSKRFIQKIFFRPTRKERIELRLLTRNSRKN